MNETLSYLLTPSNSEINPPINTKKSDLPIEDLGWEDFEKLCLKLVEIDYSIDDCEIYGVKGQKQNGIDIFAKKDNGKYSSSQCKKYKSLTVANFTKAVNLFKKETWYSKSDEFIFCTTFEMNKTQLQDKFNSLKVELKKDGVKLVKWDKIQICKLLKKQPQIVYDFFGRQWVELFNGPEFLKSISSNRKLDANEVIIFRKELYDFYSIIFNTHDSGIGIQQLKSELFPIQDRFIMPDAYEYYKTSTNTNESLDNEQSKLNYNKLINEVLPENEDDVSISFLNKLKDRKENYGDSFVKNRINIDSVITKNNRSIIIGDPGTGKSTLLRNLVLDILAEKPKFLVTAENWGKYLPIWMPFAFVTKNLKENNNLSISDLLRMWFKAYEKENLFKIINNVLGDERLILIIDGVDELADISSAQNAITKIEIHASLANTRTIYSSRPYGYKLLKDSFSRINEVHLLPFSENQQKKFILFWIEKWLISIKKYDKRYANKLTSEFLIDLNNSAELKYLAETPLLLSILTSQRLRDSALPNNKIKALEKITEHLITIHPNKRRVSANITESKKYNFDLIDVFQELAIHIQTNINDGVIEKTEAKKIIESYLIRLLGFSIPEAKKHSQDIFDIGANEYGLIIEKTNTEIAFTHRLFQEYLSAKYLYESDDEYIDIISTYGGIPLWHQVIKLYFSLIPQNKIKYYEEAIKHIGIKNANESYKQLIEFLKYDIVLTSNNSPLKLASEYLHKIIPLFEYETDEDVKNTYWNIILNSLNNVKLKSEVKHYLFQYFPNYYKYSDYRLFAISKLDVKNFNNYIGDFLVKTLINGNTHQKKDVSSVIRKFLINKEFLKSILNLIDKVSNPEILPYLINCVISKNVDKSTKEKVLMKFLNADNKKVQLFVIKLKVHLGCQNLKDFENFIQFQNSLDSEFGEDIFNILIDGWPKSKKLFKIALDSVDKEYYRDTIYIDKESSWKILLHCFNDKKEVLDKIINEITKEEYPFIGFSSSHKLWSYLSHYYKNNKELTLVADEWLQKQEFRTPEIAYACQIGRTESSKKFLFKFLPKSSFSHWITMALIEGWKDDLEVIDYLKSYFEGNHDNKYASYGYIDLVYANDKKKGIQILEDYINQSKPTNIDRAITALIKLDKDYFKQKWLKEIIENHLKKMTKNDIINRYQNIIYAVLTNYSQEEIVKDYAFNSIINEKDNLHLIIEFYPNEIESINNILNKSIPVSIDYQLKLINKFQENSIIDIDILNKLSEFNNASEEICMSTAGIALFKQLQSNNPNEIIRLCQEKVFYRGYDYQIHRQLAFCGYLITNKLSDYFSLVEEDTKGIANPEISYDSSFSKNISDSMIDLYINNFESIYKEINGDFSRIQRYSGKIDQNIWSFWARNSNKNSPTYPYIINYIKENESEISNLNLLDFLNRTMPNSKLLKNICLRMIKKKDRYYNNVYLVSRILGENFNDDENVYKELIKIDNIFLEANKIVALCIGWPDDKKLKEIFDEVVKEEFRINKSVTYHLKFIFRDINNIIEFLNLVLNDSNDRYYEHAHFIKPLLIRIGKDYELQNRIKEELLKTDSINVKISFYSLLENFNSIDSEILQWRNLKEQLNDFDNYGYDIIRNEIVMFKKVINPLSYVL